MAEIGVGLRAYHRINFSTYQRLPNVSCQLRNKELRLFSRPRTAEISLLQSAVCRM